MLPNSNISDVFDRSALPSHADVDGLYFPAGRRSQSAELNDMQQYMQRRVDKLGGAIFSDGSITAGGIPSMTTSNPGYTILITAGSVFIRGKVFDFDAALLDIPLDQEVAVGLRLHTSVVDYTDDATLLSPAVHRRGYMEPGAYRAKSIVIWGWKAADGSDDGSTDDFFPVYSVDNGVIITSTDSPVTDIVYKALAQYDRDSNGNYVSAGFRIRFVSEVSGNYSFQVDAGSAHLLGNIISRKTDTRLNYAKDPNAATALNEYHIFTPDISGKMNVVLSRPPVASVTSVVGQKTKTISVVRGLTTGGSDIIDPDIDSIVSIQSVVQGGTTYGQGTDFALSGDEISWAPSGTEPATGSTYTVAFTYVDSLSVPDLVTANYIVLSGYVSGQSVLISYTYNLPRVDLIVLNADGTLSRIIGVAALQNPGMPTAGPNQIALASVQYDWINPPAISNISIRAVLMSDLENMRASIFDLFQLHAQLQLVSNVAQSDAALKLGVFVDSLKDDSQRDAGTAQTAAVVNGFLTLPIATTALHPDGAANALNQTLPFTPVVAISQPLMTQCAVINAYANLTTLDGTLKLNPASDSWSVYDSQYASQLTALIVQSGLVTRLSPTDAREARRQQQLSGTTTTVEVVTSSMLGQELSRTTTRGIAVRQTSVTASISGFLPGEKILTATFDGVSLAALVDLVADINGVIEHAFTIPAGVPTGVKQVAVQGDLGTYAETTYTASFSLLPGLPPPQVAQYLDPVAQTFVPDEDIQVCAVDLKFCRKGPTLAPVVVQIREVVNGYPSLEALCSTQVSVNSLNIVDTITATATLNTVGWIYSATPTTAYAPSPAQGQIGFHQSGWMKRVLAKFTLPSNLAGSVVSSARLTMRLYHSTPITTLAENPRPFFVTASRLTEAFDPSTATWNNRQTGTPWTTAGGTSFASSSNPAAIMPNPATMLAPVHGAIDRNPDAYNLPVSWDLTTIVAAWAAGSPNNGIMLSGTMEALRTTNTITALALLDFAGFTPTLEITYKPVSSGLLGEGWTRVNFDLPTFVKKGTQYALAILTSDPGHSVGFARLGDMATAYQNNGFSGILAQNPYGPGVMFDSPNNATWIARPKDDLTFRIVRASYTSTSATVTLGNVPGTSATDFIPRGLIDRVSGDTTVTFNVTPPGGSLVNLQNSQTLPLTAPATGNFAVQAVLTGTEKLSPILYANTLGIVGTIAGTGTYVNNRVPAADTFSAHAIFNILLPAGASVSVKVANATYSSGVRVVVDGVDQFTWLDMTLISSQAADNGFVQLTWGLTGVRGITTQNLTQMKITLSGSASARLLVQSVQFYTK